MVEITAKIFQQLRQKTGLVMMDCNKALKVTNGDVESAILWLRKKSIAVYTENETITAEGIISIYIDTGDLIE